MGVSADELVRSLLKDPHLAYQVAKSLSESSLVGPWKTASGIENSYQKTYERQHISGHPVGTVCKTVSGAVWWTINGTIEHAGSLPAARAEVDRDLIDSGFILSSRGILSPWSWENIAWLRYDNSGNRIARVWGNPTGKFELFEFAFSDYTTQIIRDTPTLAEAKEQADEILVEQGWKLR